VRQPRRNRRKKSEDDTAKVEAYLREKAVTTLPPAYAEGVVRGPTAKSRSRTRKSD
jgi:hypothetical protein